MRSFITCVALSALTMSMGCGKSRKWETYSSANHRYSLELPGKAWVEPGSSAEAEQVTCQLDKENGFAVRAERMPLKRGQVVSKEKAQSVLQDGVKRLTKLGGDISKNTSVEIDGEPGVEFVIENAGSGIVIGRGAYWNSTIYVWYAVGDSIKESDKDIRRFLDSFHLAK